LPRRHERQAQPGRRARPGARVCVAFFPTAGAAGFASATGATRVPTGYDSSVRFCPGGSRRLAGQLKLTVALARPGQARRARAVVFMMCRARLHPSRAAPGKTPDSGERRNACFADASAPGPCPRRACSQRGPASAQRRRPNVPIRYAGTRPASHYEDDRAEMCPGRLHTGQCPTVRRRPDRPASEGAGIIHIGRHRTVDPQGP
jgi:hypothetical protein